LLARGYEITSKNGYLQEAVQYVRHWSAFESSIIVPTGLVFNDHATAARALVVTEIWRLYRNSSIYDAGDASDLLHYAQKLTQLLSYPKLYEYRTNHGIMQNLSLLHLAIAFPLLETSDTGRQVGKSRLLSQLEYYVNKEGVILEHSPGYHHNGLRRLAAAWRYFGLKGDPVPLDFVNRYSKSLEMRTAFLRPDGTLPPIGDTGDYKYAPIQVAHFDNSSVVSAKLRDDPQVGVAPDAVTAAPGAGWVVLWGGLRRWPDSAFLSQTVLHWGNFPTKAHKHADDLGISLWSNGVQWVRGVGYWPYERSRNAAIGWRSSNGPHWLNEPAVGDRHSALAGTVTDDVVTYLDAQRGNGGSSIRRQLAKVYDNTWILLDSFESPEGRPAELVWRLSPDIILDEISESEILLSSESTGKRMNLTILGSEKLQVDSDLSGTSEWNTGLMIGDEIGKSPAIRITASGKNFVVISVFRLEEVKRATVGHHPVKWSWKDAVHWQVSTSSEHAGEITVEREAGKIRVSTNEALARTLPISMGMAEAAAAPREDALRALSRSIEEYGIPYEPMSERRVKLTLVIVATTMAQLPVFFLLRRKRNKLALPLASCSFLAWIGLSLYLGTNLLV
jgi:hypothetical protein